MRHKSIYPYEYTDNCEKIEEARLLPKNAYYNIFNITSISDQDYEHSPQVWNRIIPDQIYLAADVWLLADVFKT